MDEAFDYWYRPKGGNPHCAQFQDTFKDDTIAMVQDAYNHPCVIMYSIGNEIPEAGSLKGARVGKNIVDTIHSIDTTRPTTLCPSVHCLREYLDGVPYLTEDEDEWMSKAPENKEADWKHYMKSDSDKDKVKPYTECYVVFPGGVGVVPWMVPGGPEIAKATCVLMEQYDTAIWAFHGLFVSGADFNTVFGLMHTIEKAAERGDSVASSIEANAVQWENRQGIWRYMSVSVH